MSRFAASPKRSPRSQKSPSTILKGYRPPRRRNILFLLGLLAACCTFYYCCLRPPSGPVTFLAEEGTDALPVETKVEPTWDARNLSSTKSYEVRPEGLPEPDADDDNASLVAILPVTEASLAYLHATISVLLHAPGTLSEIVLLAPSTSHQDIRTTLGRVFSEDFSDLLDVSIATWPVGIEEGISILQTARQISADRFLFMDSSGLNTVDAVTRHMLVGSFATPLPVGPRGFDSSDGQYLCILANDDPQASAFLLPPFSISSLLVPPHDLEPTPVYDIWSALGQHISRGRFERAGGVAVAGNASIASSWCSGRAPQSLLEDSSSPTITVDANEEPDILVSSNRTQSLDADSAAESLAFLVPRFTDVYSFGAALCRMRSQSFQVRVLAVEEAANDEDYFKTLTLKPDCRVDVSLPRAAHSSYTSDWLFSDSSAPQVVLHSGLAAITIGQLQLSKSMPELTTSVFIDIPESQLQYCDWMGTLTMQEWRHWHTPQVDISIITNDRAQSLSRLLDSLQNALFYGDKLNLRINIEQTADLATLQVADQFAWEHGAVFIHRRVIHGGLLPAVVESWYPSSNDSYGLILEDDVELSPLFYAWVKMSLLRYRYGSQADSSPHLYGISLYQQKNLELRPEGRHRFDARALFRAAGLPHAHTPFLSAIPCSWGAVYFPGPWRAFHAYLAVRLAGAHRALPLAQVVAPGVRSNRWTHSWKKYFIELVFLRGDAMLYPNYAGFRSLSTNHLEVGSHVKVVSPDVYERKKKLYLLPLVELPPENGTSPLSTLETGLLDLPMERMPPWRDLPVTDLFGLLTSMDSLVDRGLTRRSELFDCQDTDFAVDDVRQLLCMEDEDFD